jgi:primosomal protein N' (replication factor Y) (superfamily II helicase)
MTTVSSMKYAQVWVDVPITGPFDYRIPDDWTDPEFMVGKLAVVPWGNSRRVGLISAITQTTQFDPARVKPLEQLLHDGLTLPAWWMKAVLFASTYYHKNPGELGLPAIPKLLRVVSAERVAGSKRKLSTPWENASERLQKHTETNKSPPLQAPASIVLTVEQQESLTKMTPVCAPSAGFGVQLLHGITGSGKTEIYLRLIEQMLEADPAAQALLLLPEIALTPQFLALLQQRFPQHPLALLNSAMPDAARTAQWVSAYRGHARIIVGTRLAVFTPFASLRLIVVDEEHDPSYKQAEGVHYSGRDMAVAIGAQLGCPVVLGSATPSLETWDAAQKGRYALVSLKSRALAQAPPNILLINIRGMKLQYGLSVSAIEAIKRRLAKGEQSLIFLNRRGFAPVLHCGACEWLSACENCSAYKVLHRAASRSSGYRMVCHHCGVESAVPKGCPDCGSVDLSPVGQGTQRLEEGLTQLLPAARIGRLDRDVARKRGATEQVLAAAHAGHIDILVGTQMLAKGHNFTRLTLVVVVNADSGLFAADFRAPERLFANLLQVAGRAGRAGQASEVLVQTQSPDHPVFAALQGHDYVAFANQQLAERHQAALPPSTYQALLRGQAKTLAQAMHFLTESAQLGEQLDDASQGSVRLYDPVPMPMMRIAGVERAQLLLESRSRPALHRFLAQWLPLLQQTKTPVRWQLDVDPQEI